MAQYGDRVNDAHCTEACHHGIKFPIVLDKNSGCGVQLGVSDPVRRLDPVLDEKARLIDSGSN